MTAAALLLMSGIWRYLIPGTALAVLSGLVCRTFGKLLALPAQWRRFTGTCTETVQENGKTAIAVQFTDGHMLQHTAAFCLPEPAASAVRRGDSVRFAMRAEAFSSGSYPQCTADASAADGILSDTAFRRMRLRETCRVLLSQTVLCGIALAAFMIAMKLCF